MRQEEAERIQTVEEDNVHMSTGKERKKTGMYFITSL